MKNARALACFAALVLLLPNCMKDAQSERKKDGQSKKALSANPLLAKTVNSGTARLEFVRAPAEPAVIGNGIVDFNQDRSYLAFELPGGDPRAKMEFISEGTDGFLLRSPTLIATTWWKRSWPADLQPASLHQDLGFLWNDPIGVLGLVTLAEDMVPPEESGGEQPRTVTGTAMLDEARVASLVPSVRLLASALVADGVNEVPIELTLDGSGRISTLVLTRGGTTYNYRFSDYGAELEVPKARGDVRDLEELGGGIEREEGGGSISRSEELPPPESPHSSPT